MLLRVEIHRAFSPSQFSRMKSFVKLDADSKRKGGKPCFMIWDGDLWVSDGLSG